MKQHLRIFLGTFVFILISVNSSYTTPLYPATQDCIKAASWPEDTRICIYIEDNGNADCIAAIKEGMERWQSHLATRPLSIDVKTGDPPDPPDPNCDAVVLCTFEPDGTSNPMAPGLELGSENDGLSGCTTNGNNDITGAQIMLRDNICSTPTELLKNMAEHEVCHAIGIWDDGAGVVTNHNQYEPENELNAVDYNEIELLYPVDWGAIAIPMPIEFTNEQYTIEFTYEGPSGNSHIPLILLNIHPDIIDSVYYPAGWTCFNPADSDRTSIDYPFYDGYMEDCGVLPSPLDSTLTPPLGFRSIDGSTALTYVNPTVQFTISLKNAEAGQIQVWAGGNVQTIIGPVPSGIPKIPTMRTWGIVLVTVILLLVGILCLKKFQRKNAPVG